MNNRKSEVYAEICREFIIIGADIEPDAVKLKDGKEVFGQAEEFTSRVLGARQSNIVKVTLWGPDILHSHRKAEETYICMGGEGEIFLENDIYRFIPRMIVIIRPKVLHAARPKRGWSKKLVFACVSAPPFDPSDVFEDSRGRNW